MAVEAACAILPPPKPTTRYYLEMVPSATKPYTVISISVFERDVSQELPNQNSVCVTCVRLFQSHDQLIMAPRHHCPNNIV
jgi:hypothetical protein